MHHRLLRPEAGDATVASHPSRAHLRELQAHAVQRGPRAPAPAGSTDPMGFKGHPDLADDDPVFYRVPLDTFDENGVFVSRITRPVTRKAAEVLFTRIKRHLLWTMLHGLRPHDIRHTSSVIVYKASHHQLAQLHLAHAANTTEHYLQESLAELAHIRQGLFGDADDLREWAAARTRADPEDPDDEHGDGF